LLSADNARQWSYNTGSNKNEKGNQKTGSVRIGSQAESVDPSGAPINAKDVGGANTGGNINQGECQQTGDIDIGNQTNPARLMVKETRIINTGGNTHKGKGH